MSDWVRGKREVHLTAGWITVLGTVHCHTNANYANDNINKIKSCHGSGCLAEFTNNHGLISVKNLASVSFAMNPGGDPHTTLL
jgi:hypothetical protein